MTAEQRILAKVNGKDTYRWVKRRPRNEVLDCRNYALHAAMALGIHKWPEARWLQLEQAVQPPQDLFSPAPTATPAAPITSAEQAAATTPHTAPQATSHTAASPPRRVADAELFAPISMY